MVGMPGNAPGLEQSSTAKEFISLSRVLHPPPMMAVTEGFEPSTHGVEIRCSILLS